MLNFHSSVGPGELLDTFCRDHHLPLDWNEDLSLEEYLECIDGARKEI